MFKKNKNKALVLAALGIIALPLSVHAATDNIDVTASFKSALTLANPVAMAFGTIEFTGTPDGTDTASLGTNGSITYTNNFSGSGTGTAGSIDITTGTVGQTVEVFCDATASMTDAGGINPVTVDTIEVVSETTGGQVPGGGSACVNVTTASTTMVLTAPAGAGDQFLFGGRIVGNANITAGDAYSTANANGDNVEIRVFYQ